ncbi:hypothetical protein, partial [Marinobacter sp. F3R08]|uniref:hypothetical protein n=1 Tax=Marinobacter sp. F3R08 TaxID=2841559 RepID=UPI001C09193E
KTHFLQHFQTVISRFPNRLSGVPLERDAHSTGVRETVNDVFKLIGKYLGFPLLPRSDIDQTGRFSGNTGTLLREIKSTGNSS